ncbi:hypothetical protein [Companilactobacillus sp. HBUAS59699]|uniref:hypothetical protein n=1 Tax=Companilactobacillus sp. HBUAS59699 TaxID=3109358 RepID=UPI002FEEAAC0
MMKPAVLVVLERGNFSFLQHGHILKFTVLVKFKIEVPDLGWHCSAQRFHHLSPEATIEQPTT